jgi:O-acetylserine/cysteine efflux transporter
MQLRDLILALFVVLVWGANFTVIHLGLNGVPPLLLAALRYLLAALPAVFFIKRPSVPLRYVCAYGLFVGFGQFGCLFYAMHLGMPAGIASVVLQSQAFFTLLLASLLLRETIAPRQIAGLGLAMAGLYLVGDSNGSTGLITTGAFALTLIAAAFWGASNIVVKKANQFASAQGNQLDILSLVVWSALIPPLPLLTLSLIIESPQIIAHAMVNLNTVSIFSIAYLAFAATLFGYGAWSRLLSRYPANKVAPLSLLVPVAGLITARLVLSEQLTTVQWSGCLLVVAGLAFATFISPRR